MTNKKVAEANPPQANLSFITIQSGYTPFNMVKGFRPVFISPYLPPRLSNDINDVRIKASGRPDPDHADDSSTKILSLQRGLSRRQSAKYIGTGTTLFNQMVEDGRMPKPKRVNSRTIWDRYKLDEYFDDLPDEVDNKTNPWDQ